MAQENNQTKTTGDELNIPISRPLPRKDTLVRNGTHLRRSGREADRARSSRREWRLQGWLMRGAGDPHRSWKSWDHRRKTRKEAVTGPHWRKGADHAFALALALMTCHGASWALGSGDGRAVPARLGEGRRLSGQGAFVTSPGSFGRQSAGHRRPPSLTSSAAAAETSGRRRRLGASGAIPVAA